MNLPLIGIGTGEVQIGDPPVTPPTLREIPVEVDIPIDLPPPITGQLIVVGIHTVAPGIGYTPGDSVTITGTGDDSGNPK